jgi:threonine dehydrogenase-like Zn-dependent dehydrogenase
LIVCRALGWSTSNVGRDLPDTFRSQLAQRFGAKYIAAKELTGEPRDVEQDGFDLILECTGSDTVLVQTAQYLASCGVMVWLGSSRMPRPRLHNLDALMRSAVLRNHIHLGTVNAAPRDFVAALRHLEELHELIGSDLATVITERVSLKDSLWHYQHRVLQGIKTVVMYET